LGRDSAEISIPAQAVAGQTTALTVKNDSDSFAPLSTEKVVKAQEGKICTRF